MATESHVLSSKNLEKYGVWVKIEPREVKTPTPFAENQNQTEAVIPLPSQNVQGLDDNLDSILADFPISFDEVGESIPLAPSNSVDSQTTLSQTHPENASEHIDPSTRTTKEPQPKDSLSSGIATEILGKITQELASIRSELSSLRSQIKSNTSTPVSHDIFEESEDETITLTGDELENILHSANVKSVVSDAEELEEQNISQFASNSKWDSTDILHENILPETGFIQGKLDRRSETNTQNSGVAIKSLNSEEYSLSLLEAPSQEELNVYNAMQDSQNSKGDSLDDMFLDMDSQHSESANANTITVNNTLSRDNQNPLTELVHTSDENLRNDIRNVLSYLDKLLDALPESKIEEFARSPQFDTYKRLFEDLGLA